jgi:hypothetical protein
MKPSLKRRRSPEQVMEMEAAGNAPQEAVEGSGEAQSGSQQQVLHLLLLSLLSLREEDLLPSFVESGHCRQRCGIRQHEITMRRREIACRPHTRRACITTLLPLSTMPEPGSQPS